MLKTLSVAALAALIAGTAIPEIASAQPGPPPPPRHRVVHHRQTYYNNCKSAAHKGTAGGAVLGALAGQALGHNTTSTVVGAGVGAAAGHSIRYNNCKKRR
jgi:uncharacterized protein YcfJ